MELATWVLVGVTLLYVILTGGLVIIGWKQFIRLANPVVGTFVEHATVGSDARGPFLQVRFRSSVLGAAPALNVCISGQLQLLESSTSPKRSHAFEYPTLPILAIDGKVTEELLVHVPELGQPGTDHREIPIYLSITTEYRDTSAREHVSLYVAAPISIKTPLDPAHSWGVRLDRGVFHSEGPSLLPWKRLRRALAKRRARRRV